MPDVLENPNVKRGDVIATPEAAPQIIACHPDDAADLREYLKEAGELRSIGEAISYLRRRGQP